MTEQQIKDIVNDFKAGMKMKDLTLKYNVRDYYISGLIGKLRKAGAVIPKRTKIGGGIDFAKLAGEINAGN